MSTDHIESVARAIAVLQAIREEEVDSWEQDQLKKATGVCAAYLLGRPEPLPDIPDSIQVDRSTIRNAVISIDRVESEVSFAGSRALSDAMDILDERQQRLQEVRE